MDQLPIIFKKYFPERVSGANVTFSYWYEPREEDLRQSRGGLGLLVSLMGPDDFSGERASKFMWDSFQEAYYYEKGSVRDAMRNAVKSAQKRLVDLIKNEEVISEQGVDLHMCAFAVHNEEGFFSMIGSPSVTLVRGDEVISLSEMLPSYTGSGYRDEVTVGNFKLEEKDIILMSTPKLVESFLDVAEADDGDRKKGLNELVTEMELFSENLTGNQYIWMIGYGYEEDDIGQAVVPPDEGDRDDGEEFIGEDTDSGSGEGRKDDGNEDDGPEIHGMGEEEPEGEKEESEGNDEDGTTHTPGGIYGVVTGTVGTAWSEHVRPKLNAGDIKDKVRSGKESLTDKTFWSGLRRSVSSKISGMKLGSGKRQMRIGTKKSPLVRFGVPLAICLVILGVGVYSWNQRQERLRQEQIESTFDETGKLAEEALTAWEVQKDRQTTESKLEEATAELDEISGDDLDEAQQETLDELRDDIQGVYDQMNRVSAVTEDLGTLEILTDLYLKIGEEVDVTDIEKYGKSLYVVDNASHTVYRYTPADDVIEPVANSEDVMKSPRYIAVGEGYMFVYDEEVGVLTLDMNESEPDWVFKIRPALSAQTIGAVEEIAAFADNVYILKKDEARVLKSYPAGSGYSYPEEYFRNGSFDKAVDILIDGNIYVYSNASDKIFKYFGGKQDKFSLSGFEIPLGLICCGTTNLNDSSTLYVFDAENERIVSIEKGTPQRHPGVGVMIRQYLYRGERDDVFKDVKEIVVDVDERMVYVLDGTRILQVLLENE